MEMDIEGYGLERESRERKNMLMELDVLGLPIGGWVYHRVRSIE